MKEPVKPTDSTSNVHKPLPEVRPFFATGTVRHTEDPMFTQRPRDPFFKQNLFQDGGIVQAKRTEVADPSATPIKTENKTGIPDDLKANVEALSGMDMSGVKVHYASSRPADIGALAYAQGNEIHLGAGQEKHLPHEVWHVVQQAQGRVKPTMQLKSGIPVNDDAGLEQEADLMGNQALQMKTDKSGSRNNLVSTLRTFNSIIQRWRDHNNKWHEPPDPKENDPDWERVDEPGKRYYRPRKGSAEEKSAEDAKAAAAAKLAAERAAINARNDALSEKWERLSVDTDSVFLEDPGNIFFTQDSIDYYFQDGGNVDSLVEALRSGKVTAAEIQPIKVQYYGGRLWSYDNRRLYAFRHAGIQVRCQFGTQAYFDKNRSKLTGDGKGIKVRNRPIAGKKK